MLDNEYQYLDEKYEEKNGNQFEIEAKLSLIILRIRCYAMLFIQTFIVT